METVGRLRPSTRAVDPHDNRAAATDDEAVRLLVVDEHEVTSVGLGLALSGPGWAVESTTGPTSGDVVEHVRRFRPWCVLLGVNASDDPVCGAHLVTDLVREGAEVILLTTERRRALLAEYLEAGAAGWVPRTASLDVLRTTIAQFRNGVSVICRNDQVALLDLLRRERAKRAAAQSVVSRLTEREACVLVALADGLNAEQIAAEHFVSLATIRTQIRAVLQKLDVRSQLAAASIGETYRDLLPTRSGSERDRRRLRAAHGPSAPTRRLADLA